MTILIFFYGPFDFLNMSMSSIAKYAVWVIVEGVSRQRWGWRFDPKPGSEAMKWHDVPGIFGFRFLSLPGSGNQRRAEAAGIMAEDLNDLGPGLTTRGIAAYPLRGTSGLAASLCHQHQLMNTKAY